MNCSIQLCTKRFIVDFPRRPGVLSIARLNSAACLEANPAKLPNIWTLYDVDSRRTIDINDDSPAVQYSCTVNEDHIFWDAEICINGECVRARVQALVEEDSLKLVLSHFVETSRIHIVMLRLNGLAAATESDEASRLALPAHGGRLIDPATCANGRIDHRYNWILDSLGCAAIVYTTQMTAVVRVRMMDNQLTSMVGGISGKRFAQLGSLLRHRYTLNDSSYSRAKPGRSAQYSEDTDDCVFETDFALEEDPFVDVDMIAHDDVEPCSGWTIGACHVRGTLQGKRTDFYKGKLVYKIFVGAPGEPVQTDIHQIRSLIFALAARTGNGGQVPYIVGFQHQGHDSGYPDVFALNPALEGKDALEKLVKDAQAVNCTLSFHDNFDDAYAASPSWSSDDIARDNAGHLLRGGIWNGAQAYWNSMPWYAGNKTEARIRKTLHFFPFLKHTYHLDVLTASVFRVDFRKGSPSGKQKDLQARLQIVEQFRNLGLDVTSEACGLPFIGTISYFWHMQRMPFSLYDGDRRIPMVPFLVHGKADYAGTHTDTPRNILDGLLYAGFYSNDVTASTPMKELTDAYFMVQMPLDKLRDDLAVTYKEWNAWKSIRYKSGAVVSVNFESEECSVEVDGRRILQNGCLMMPQADGSTLVYRSREEPYMAVQWYTGFAPGTHLTASAIGVSQPQETMLVDEKGCVGIELPLGIAYRVELAKNEQL